MSTPDSIFSEDSDEEFLLRDLSEETLSNTISYADKKNATMFDRKAAKDFLKHFSLSLWKKKPYKYGVCKQPIYTTQQQEASSGSSKGEEPMKKRPLTEEVWFLPNGENVFMKLHKTAKTLKNITNSAGYILYLVSEDLKELFICPKKWEYFSYNRFSWKIRVGKTIATYVARKNEGVIVDTTDLDIRFPRGQELGHLFNTDIIAVPLTNFDGTCMGVIELYRENEVPYEQCHLKLLSFILKWAGEVIYQNKEKIFYENLITTLHTLLKTLKECYSFVTNDELTTIFYQKAMSINKVLADADCASIYILKNEEAVNEASTIECSKANREIEKIMRDKKLFLANLTLKSGWIVNMSDVYNDSRFNNDVDIESGYIIRSVLQASFAGTKHLVGVLQLLNKLSGIHQFFAIDEIVTMVCANFCAFWYYYKNLWNFILYQMNISKQREEFLYYLISKEILEEEIFDMDQVNKIPNYLTKYSFYPYPKHINNMPKLLYIMFNNSCNFNLHNSKILYNFIYMVKKCYRSRPHYNFEFFFTCTQFIFALLHGTSELFTNNEKISLMIAMFCTGIDCKGHNVEYFEAANDPLLKLYNDCPLERHAMRLTRLILETSNILKNLNNEDQEIIMNMIDENILATNFLKHIEIHNTIAAMIAKNEHDWKNPEHRKLLRAVTMAAARLCMRLKPIPYLRRGLNTFFDEILQGEEGFLSHNKYPARDKHLHERRACYCFVSKVMEIADIPCYEVMKNLFPFTAVLHRQAIDNYRILVNIFHSELNILEAENIYFKETPDRMNEDERNEEVEEEDDDYFRV